MAIRIVRLGTPKKPGEGPRLGTVRYPPRGVPKAELATRAYYDAWLPALAPSAELVAWYREDEESEERWQRFARRYRAEMKQPDKRQLLGLLAALSHAASFSVGCYCADEQRCHRSLLRELLAEHGATLE
jgi:uncharacterized protein YeaO (DUF488 family)